MATKRPQTNSEGFVVFSGDFSYRNREDKTILPPNILVEGSQNVLTSTTGRVGTRKGYTLDGAASAVLAGILSSYDYEMHTGQTQHLRGGFLTSAGNDGKLQYRYVDSDGNVTWRDLLTSQTSVSYNFTDFWDQTNFQSVMLFVNGDSTIKEWSGGVTTVASGTLNTITKEGTTTWAEEGFYTTGTHSVTIDGVDYQATGGWGTTTLTGVTPDASGISAGEIAHQKVESWSNASGLPSTFSNDIIGNLRNQIYVGSLSNRSVYVSQVNDYKDYTFATPRVVGEGAILTLDGVATALIPQEESMYISAGKDQWYETAFQLSSDLANESLTVRRLKTASMQGAKSQGLTSKIANSVVYVSNEPQLNSLGRVENILGSPEVSNISYAIVNDMDNLDFTDGQVAYNREFVYVSAPRDNTVLVYNMTNPENPYWEAPQILPVGRFSIIDGELYGHSYNTSETYKLFDGYNDNGNFIDARAVFAFDSAGDRSKLKGFNEFYLEGYISSNTTLALGLQYDIDGCATQTEHTILGSDTRIVCIGSEENALGKFALGKEPLGSNADTVTNNPKFRVIKTFSRVPHYEYQPSFSSNGVNQQWEVLAFGPGNRRIAEQNVGITQ